MLPYDFKSTGVFKLCGFVQISKDNREKKLRVSLHLFNEKEIMKKANELALTF